MLILQKLSENFVTIALAYANLVAQHSKRDAIFPRDLQLVRAVRQESQANGIIPRGEGKKDAEAKKPRKSHKK